MNAKLCAQCGHTKETHAEFIDNMIGSSTYVPERRQCLYEDGCSCAAYKPSYTYAAPHKVLSPSTHDEVMESDNKIIKDGYEKSTENDKSVAVVRSEPICDTCEHARYPGILWPIDYDTGYAWIMCCDEWGLFAGDH